MTWETRDLPVLKALVELDDEGDNGRVTVDAIAERIGMGKDQVGRAIRVLSREEPRFFELGMTSSLADTQIHHVYNVSGHARRAVGTWPTAERLAEQIVAGLNAAADAEPDEEKRSRLKQAAQILGGAGWGVILGVAGNAVSKGIGL